VSAYPKPTTSKRAGRGRPNWRVRVSFNGSIIHLTSFTEPVGRVGNVNTPESGDTVGFIDWPAVVAVTWRRNNDAPPKIWSWELNPPPAREELGHDPLPNIRRRVWAGRKKFSFWPGKGGSPRTRTGFYIPGFAVSPWGPGNGFGWFHPGFKPVSDGFGRFRFVNFGTVSLAQAKPC
jgi:hypothetical protein